MFPKSLLSAGWWVDCSCSTNNALCSEQAKAGKQQELIQQQQQQCEQPQHHQLQQAHQPQPGNASRLVPVRVHVRGKGVAQPGARLLSHGRTSADHTPSHRQETRPSAEPVAVQIVATQLQDSQVLKNSPGNALGSDSTADAPQPAAVGRSMPARAASPNVFDANELDLTVM